MVVSNSLDNIHPRHYDFKPFLEVRENKQVCFVVDDSHGIGVIHKNKVSVDLDWCNKPNISSFIVASLAKGLGTDAAFCCFFVNGSNFA